MTYRKKLIEVALPLDAINKASANEKSIRHGNPSTLHQWWSRKPLATCRAVLFASLIDDPAESLEKFPTEREQELERRRLFQLMEELVKWGNTNNRDLLQKVQAEILKVTGDNPPPVLDPFCGGGSILLEAQRLGLEAYGSDLNPVAVLITKALIEIPPKFADHPPVNPEAKKSLMQHDWRGSQGLADDVRYYGQWMRDEAERRIKYLYPQKPLPKEFGGGMATVIAWHWARTIKCPNPACGGQMPLVRSFWLSTKRGNEAWIDPEVNYNITPPTVCFSIKTGVGVPHSGTVSRQGAICICCGTSVTLEYVRDEAQAGRMKDVPMAITVEAHKGRLHLPSDSEDIQVASSARPEWKPNELVTTPSHDVDRLPMYGMYTWGDAFTPRQLVTLTTFCDLINEARKRVITDAKTNGMLDDDLSFNDGGKGARAYADGIATYLAESVSKLTTFHNKLSYWRPKENKSATGFSRQALAMMWSYAEVNPFAGAGGDFEEIVTKAAPKVISQSLPAARSGLVRKLDAKERSNDPPRPIISTDPPYYDNVGYADLSDFYYVWLRYSLSKVYPDLFNTLLTPKSQELVATPHRFGGDKAQAQYFFEEGLGQAFIHMRNMQHPDYPLTVYYAFKQTESEDEDEENRDSNVASTGWETMLEGLLRSGFSITGTWPIRTEMGSRMGGHGSNSLASSIVLVCRPRPVDAPIASRRDFLKALRAELPLALKNLQHGSVAPVDLAQASIGPGMSIYSRYSKVVESDGTPLSVRTALQLINRALDEVLAEQEGEYDAETRWAIAWFEQYAMDMGEYGVAETLSKAKNMSVENLEHAGLVVSKAGKVRLRRREELSEGWNPKMNARLTVWEVMQRLIHALDKKGEVGAGDVLRKASAQGEIARDLAYRLYTVCERKGWAQEALAYNSLVASWLEISRLAQREASDGSLWEATYLQ